MLDCKTVPPRAEPHFDHQTTRESERARERAHLHETPYGRTERTPDTVLCCGALAKAAKLPRGLNLSDVNAERITLTRTLLGHKARSSCAFHRPRSAPPPPPLVANSCPAASTKPVPGAKSFPHLAHPVQMNATMLLAVVGEIDSMTRSFN